MTDALQTALLFLASLAGLAVLAVILATALELWRDKEIQTRLGLDRLPHALRALPLLIVTLLSILWIALIIQLGFGLFMLTWQMISEPLADMTVQTARWDFTFRLARMAGLTAVLAGLLALPFTIIRIYLTNQQNRTARASLFNEKLNAALEDLYSRRRVTQWHRKEGHKDHWQDDITRRNAAINRLERLADDPDGNPEDIARMLAIYIRELSKENPPEPAPKTDDIEAIRKWARALKPKRTDIQNAAQTLGRLSGSESIRARGYDISGLPLDLRGTNLQGCDLNGLDFKKALFVQARLEGANLREAQMEGANLREAQMEGADLSGAQMKKSDLSHTDLRQANVIDADLRATTLKESDLRGAWLIRTDFRGALISDHTRLNGARGLRSISVKGAALRNMKFLEHPELAGKCHEMFGDESVDLPTEHDPDWPFEFLTEDEFFEHWRAFQRSIGQDPGDP